VKEHDMNLHLPDDDGLDRALAAALVPAPLPAGFETRLHAAVLAELAADLAAQRRRLEDDHRRELARLQQGYVRVRRETLVTVLAVAFTAGAAVAWAAPWLRAVLGVDLSLVLPLAALAIGAAAGAGVWVQRLGWPGLPRLGWLRR
jgi:hypothetical protein